MAAVLAMDDTEYPVRFPLTRYKLKNLFTSQTFIGILIIMLRKRCLVGDEVPIQLEIGLT
jgi:hypothetical protein